MSPTRPAADDKTLDQIIDSLRQSTTFCLSGHQNPDADVVGSQLAMASLIHRLGKGKKVDILNHGAPPRSLSLLKGFSAVCDVQKVRGHYDVVIVFECPGIERMGNIIHLQDQARLVINLDHHLYNPHFGDINYVDPEAPSTTALVYRIFVRAGLTLNAEEAISLFSGLVADTGWFRYSNTTPEALRVGADLLERGVLVAPLAERLYMSRRLPAITLLAYTLSHIRYRYDNRVSVLVIPRRVFVEVGATPDDLEEIVNYGLLGEGVCASLLFKELENPKHVKVSLRSKETYDINQVARAFGGGGHKNASGCTIEGPLEEAQEMVLSEMKRIF